MLPHPGRSRRWWLAGTLLLLSSLLVLLVHAHSSTHQHQRRSLLSFANEPKLLYSRSTPGSTPGSPSGGPSLSRPGSRNAQLGASQEVSSKQLQDGPALAPVNSADAGHEQCPICYEAMDKPKDVFTTDCSHHRKTAHHRIHTKCLRGWWQAKGKPEHVPCPICRYDIPSESFVNPRPWQVRHTCQICQLSIKPKDLFVTDCRKGIIFSHHYFHTTCLENSIGSYRPYDRVNYCPVCGTPLNDRGWFLKNHRDDLRENRISDQLALFRSEEREIRDLLFQLDLKIKIHIGKGAKLEHQQKALVTVRPLLVRWLHATHIDQHKRLPDLMQRVFTESRRYSHSRYEPRNQRLFDQAVIPLYRELEVMKNRTEARMEATKELGRESWSGINTLRNAHYHVYSHQENGDRPRTELFERNRPPAFMKEHYLTRIFEAQKYIDTHDPRAEDLEDSYGVYRQQRKLRAAWGRENPQVPRGSTVLSPADYGSVGRGYDADERRREAIREANRVRRQDRPTRRPTQWPIDAPASSSGQSSRAAQAA